MEKKKQNKIVDPTVNVVTNKGNKPTDDKAAKKEKMIELIDQLIKKHHKGFEKLR